MGEWAQRVRLGDLVEFQHGWPFKSDLFSQHLSGLPIVVGIGNFRYTGGFRFESTLVKEYRGPYPTQYLLRPRDILVVMTCQTAGGEILGIPARVPDDGRRYLHNQRLGRVVVKDSSRVLEDYLYWLFLSPEFHGHLVRTATGTKILHTAPSRMAAYTFDLPPLQEQRRVAEILDTIEDKIELNRRLCETLEASARAIYTALFAKRHPGDQHNTAAGSDSGLNMAPFLDLVTVVGGGTPQTSQSHYWDGGIPWFSVVDAPDNGSVWVTQTERTISEAGLASIGMGLLPVGAAILSARGTIGKVALVGTPMAMNQSCYGLVSRVGSRGYFNYFQTRDLVDELRRRAHGSVFDTITRTTLAGVEVVRPSAELVDHFEDLVSPLMLRILETRRNSATLAEVRNTLLPRLLGEEARRILTWLARDLPDEVTA